MAETLPRSTLALIERPHSFLLQERPILPGKLAYSGKLHFFGGGVKESEHPYAALERELREELEAEGWELPEQAPEPLWEGRYSGEDKHGRAVLRHITLYGLEMPGHVLAMPTTDEGGSVCLVNKDIEAIMSLEPNMAPFAYEALTNYVRSGQVLIS